VLGLPDCYVEFFDTEAKEFVNYQIDVTNLMCSRRGKIKKIHYDVMREYYLGRLGEET
jgi:vacuolar-type H+-ATPase subunit C/Vma6